MMILLLPITAAAYDNGNFLPHPTPTPAPIGIGIVGLVSPHNVVVEAGDDIDVTVVLRNVGSQPLYDLFTLAAPSNFAPFEVEFLRNTNRIAMLGVNAQRNVTMRIIVDENADPGDHFIELNHFFNDVDGRNATSSDRINVRIEGEDREANVRLSGFQTVHTGALAPEQTFTVSANIQNIGDAAARDVRVSFPENMRAADNIFVTSDLNNALFQTMDAGHSSVLNFTFQTSSDIETGAHTILFEVSFREETGNEITREVFPFIVNVYSPEDDEDDELTTLEVRGVTAPTGRVNVGQNGTISFDLYNTGGFEARNIRVEATPENENAIVPMTANVQTLRSLATGASHRVSFSFSPRDSAVTRSYAVRFRISFENESGDATDSFDQFVSFNVYNPDEEDDDDETLQIPRVMVSDYILYPPVPQAGREFEMTITFRNTSATRSVNNIRILMEEVMTQNAPGMGQGGHQHFAGFSPVGGSNTLFVDFLAPLGEVTKVLRFTTSGEATSGAHTKRISFDYQDQDFRTHEASQQISISVAQVSRLELRNVEIMPFAQVGSPVRFSFGVINSGRVNLGSVRVRMEGPFDTAHAGGEEGEFIGPLNLQRTVEFHGQFVPNEAGMQAGAFIVFGEDPTGAMVEVRYPFTIMVEGGWDMEGDFMGGDSPDMWFGDDMMGRPFPGDGGDFHFDGGGRFPMDAAGQDEPGIITRLFTREVAVAPEWWNSEFDGEFTTDMAAMHGIAPERQTRWAAVAGAIALVALAIGIPIGYVVRKKNSKLGFDDEE